MAAVLAATSWRFLQIADSAFPAGGFAHSAGLEAAVSLGVVTRPEELEAYVRGLLWNTGHAALPFVAAAHGTPQELASIDARAEALLLNHVANRASRVQGRAFVATCHRVFGGDALDAIARAVRDRALAAHLAPAFGAVLAILGVARADALALHLYFALRGITSAAVRLGAIGPLEAQRLAARLGPLMDAIVAACSDLPLSAAAACAPVLDVVGAYHDHLPARLFQS
jgi:urease accessory protein